MTLAYEMEGAQLPMRIEVIGRGGPRIALLPGLGARGEGFRKLATLLAPVVTPILVEYPVGHSAGVDAEVLAGDVLEATGPIDAVIASSMAGLVAARLVRRRAVRGVAFVSSFTHLSQLGRRERLFPLMGPIARFARPGRVAASIASWQAVRAADVPLVVPTTPEERLGVWHRAFAVAREKTSVEPFPSDIVYVALHGDRDALLPLSVLWRLGRLLPEGTPLHVLRGAGHVPYWSHPHEVRAFLEPWIDDVIRLSSHERQSSDDEECS